MTDALKPCPFCGGEAACIEETDWEIGCYNGQCATEPSVWTLSKERAIAAWNTRADLATPMRCAECDCEKGGADCNWIATPAPAVDDPQAAMDNDAVYRFSRLMQDKMAKSRAKGRSGWNDPKQCSPDYLRALLYEHIYKGDPVDVANICMMLGHYQETTQPRAKDDLRIPLTPADPLNDPRVKALVEAGKEVKADCVARADKNGVVPIGRGAWDQLTAALSALEENK